MSNNSIANNQQEDMKHVLPPKKYRLKTMLMFSEFFVLFAYVHYFMIGSIIGDVRNGKFSFLSTRMFSYYFVLGFTIMLAILAVVFKMRKAAKTRFARDNEVRQDKNIKVWLTGFDWGWPVLFIPTVVLMVIFGVMGLFLRWVFPESHTASVLHDVMGGTLMVFGALNAAVVIFKLKPVIVSLLFFGFIVILLILILHGVDTFVDFFRAFRHLGIKIEPLGYLILAYIWSLFLRIIWLRSLFFYWVFTPNRLELQHGLSESNDFVDRKDIRITIDTDDVILRLFGVGIITFYFPNLDRRESSNIVCGIGKKADYINRAAAVITVEK